MKKGKNKKKNRIKARRWKHIEYLIEKKMLTTHCNL